MANRYGTSFEYKKYEREYDSKYRFSDPLNVSVKNVQDSNVSLLSSEDTAVNKPAGITLQTDNGKSRTFK